MKIKQSTAIRIGGLALIGGVILLAMQPGPPRTAAKEAQKPTPVEQTAASAPQKPPPVIERTAISQQGAPTNAKLGLVYVNYIDVARCYNARRGYLVVHINDFEMDRAKDAVKQIEKALSPSLTVQTPDEVWETATQVAKNSMIGKLNSNFLADTHAESFCKVSYQTLMRSFQEIVPSASRIEKP